MLTINIMQDIKIWARKI